MSTIFDRTFSALLDNDTELACSLISTHEIYFDLINGRALSNDQVIEMQSSLSLEPHGFETTFIDLVFMLKNNTLLRHLHELRILRKATSHLLLKSPSPLKAARNEESFLFMLECVDFSTNDMVSLTRTATNNHYEDMAIACLDKIPRGHRYKQSFGNILSAAFTQKNPLLVHAVLNKHPGFIDRQDNLTRAVDFFKEENVPFEKVSALLKIGSTDLFIEIYQEELASLKPIINLAKTRPPYE